MTRRLGILTCIYKRHELAAVTMGHNRLAALSTGIEVVCIAVVSPDDDRLPSPAAFPEGWNLLPAPNSPLSDKWSTGLAKMREMGVDAVMIIGSDDLVHENVFRAVVASLFPGPNADGNASSGVRWFGTSDVFLLHTASWKGKHWKGYPSGSRRFGETIGTCRTFRKDLLDRVGWKLWSDGLQSGLDVDCMERIGPVRGCVLRMENCGPIIDVKSCPLVDLGHFAESEGEEVGGNTIFDGFSSELRETVKRVCDPIRQAEAVFNPWSDDEPLITACLLVRNERAMIGEALASLKGFADEVLVLDTGSDDGTQEIAEAYGAVVTQVQAPQPFDFGHWRNESIRGARGKWVLIMDGDEWLASHGNLRKELETVPDKVDAIAFQHDILGQRHADGHNPLVRLLRGDKVRNGTIYYEYPNQHQLRGVDAFQVSSALTREAYFDPVESAERSIPVLEKQLALSSAPKLVSAKNGKALGGRNNERNHALIYLARSYAMLGGSDRFPEKERTKSYEKSALYAGELVDAVPEQLGAWLVLLGVVEQVRGLIAVAPILEQAIRHHPHCRDLHWWKIRLHAGVLSVLLSQSDQYPLCPQRWPLYWKHLKDLETFSWLRFHVGEVKKQEAKEPAGA